MNTHYITTDFLDFEQIEKIINQKLKLQLSDEVIGKIIKCRKYLDHKLKESDAAVYGINTGFGALYNRHISDKELNRLQENLVKSHACGVGEEVLPEIVKLMLLLKIQSLSYGHSGVQLATVNRLVDFFNNDILPVVYQIGSLGASGDLAPLAHMSLPLIGLGEVNHDGQKYPARMILDKFSFEPIELQSKEGLALLNGTQFMSAYGIYLCLKVFKLSRLSDVIASLSLDAFDGRIEPFHPKIQEIRPHKGQIKTAARITKILDGSELINRTKEHIQDPYSFRCIPQVHGAAKDSINYVAYVFRKEINAVTDNPTIFPDEDLIISAGNFHGEPLAMAFDNLCIAMAEIGSISERRTFQLLDGKRGLPHFLVANSGLNSGFMIPQYTAAALVSQNKQLCSPASVDTIESSQGQEDHVSMGANAALKAFSVLQNLKKILAIELFNAAQALEFRRPAKTSPYLEQLLAQYRNIVPFISDDEIMFTHINNSIKFLDDLILQLPGEDVSSYRF